MHASKILLAITATLPLASAQDLRTVTQPAIPPTCAALSALNAVSEETRDTARIQSAIDACRPGHALVLRAGIIDGRGGEKIAGQVWGVKIFIDGGDDNVAIKTGAGLPTTHMTISHNHFYSGHGGLVHDVVYDIHYPFKGPGQDKIPVHSDISLRNIRILHGGKSSLDGFDATHKPEMRFDNVIGDAPGELKISGSHVTLAVGPGPMNLPVAGEDARE